MLAGTALGSRTFTWYTQMVRTVAKVGLYLAAAAVAYLLALVLVGWVADDVVAGKIQARLAGSLDAQVKVGGTDLGLVTGSVTVRDLDISRDRIDHLGLAVRRVDVDVAPLGLVVLDREPRRIRVRGARLTVTGAAALALPPRPEAPPVRVGGLEIEDGVLDLMATGYWPGLVRLTITIERARAGATTLRTALSWLFTLEELVARVDLPGGMTVRLGYSGGKLSASGGFFGEAPVTIDFVVPRLDAADEVAQLVALGKELGKQLALERARRWLDAKLAPPAPAPAPP